MPSAPSKVLYVITDSGTGGAEKVLTSLLTHLDKNNVHCVGIVVLKSVRELGRSWQKLGFGVYPLGMGKIPTWTHLSELSKIIHDTQPDIIHSFLFHSAQVCRMVKNQFPQVKLISSPRVNYRAIPAWARMLDRFLSGRDNNVVAESAATQTYLIQKMNYRPEKVTLIRNGVDCERFQFNSGARTRWRREWHIGDDDLLLGAVGRFHQQKGFDVLLSSLKSLYLSWPQLKLVLIGEGPLGMELQSFCKKNTLPVFFPGRISPLDEVYSALDIYVQSSRYEGLSNSLLEAMSVGLPIVATAVDGTLDVGIDQQNMVFVKPEDAVSLTLGIKTLLENPGLRQSLAHRARESALQLSLQKMIKEYEHLYRGLLS